MDSIRIIESYARLKALRQNVPQRRVDQRYVEEFHAIIDLLEGQSGIDLSNLRIPPAEVRPMVTRFNYRTGERNYSMESFCDYEFFCMKLDAVLTMFEVLVAPAPPSGKPPIGFNPKTL